MFKGALYFLTCISEQRYNKHTQVRYHWQRHHEWAPLHHKVDEMLTHATSGSVDEGNLPHLSWTIMKLQFDEILSHATFVTKVLNS